MNLGYFTHYFFAIQIPINPHSISNCRRRESENIANKQSRTTKTKCKGNKIAHRYIEQDIGNKR